MRKVPKSKQNGLDGNSNDSKGKLRVLKKCLRIRYRSRYILFRVSTIQTMQKVDGSRKELTRYLKVIWCGERFNGIKRREWKLGDNATVSDSEQEKVGVSNSGNNQRERMRIPKFLDRGEI